MLVYNESLGAYIQATENNKPIINSNKLDYIRNNQIIDNMLNELVINTILDTTVKVNSDNTNTQLPDNLIPCKKINQ